MVVDVYLGSDTEELYTVTRDGVDYDLDAQGITRVMAYACDGKASLVDVADRSIEGTNQPGDDITWTGNTIRMFLGHLGLRPGKYSLRIKFYDATATLGAVVQEIPIRVNC